jgi:GNAT superfamily N-acetyltransferase
MTSDIVYTSRLASQADIERLATLMSLADSDNKNLMNEPFSSCDLTYIYELSLELVDRISHFSTYTLVPFDKDILGFAQLLAASEVILEIGKENPIYSRHGQEFHQNLRTRLPSNCMLISSIYVQHDAQRTGIGSCLLKSLLSKTRYLRKSSVCVVIDSKNIAASSFFLKNSFSIFDSFCYQYTFDPQYREANLLILNLH